jgi:hypothetical protein
MREEFVPQGLFNVCADAVSQELAPLFTHITMCVLIDACVY